MLDNFQYCDDITKKSASNLWYVSRSLPKAKHKLFIASYASMRVIDDYVDDEFLPLNKNKRNIKRQFAIGKISKWKNDAILSAAGDYNDDNGEYSKIFTALNSCLSKSNLGAGAWSRLADAMYFDVKESKLNDWEDFLNYCIGATIAPAEVFLYILGCHMDNNGNYINDSNMNFSSMAKEMAVFCYLVHIMRDIAKDFKQGGQLLTIPMDILTECGLINNSPAGEFDNITERKLENLIVILIAKAEAILPDLKANENSFKSILKIREKLIFSSLLGIYRNIFKKIKNNPNDFILERINNLEAERHNILLRNKLNGD